MSIRDWLTGLFRRKPTPLLAAVNAARERWGLPILAADTLLHKVATEQAAFCKRTGVLTRESPAPLSTRLASAGVHFLNEGVALTRGTDAARAVDRWLLSPLHRDILLGDYVRAGVGRVGDVWCVICVR